MAGARWSDGDRWTVTPKNLSQSAPVPLVIQTYDATLTKQALAAHGMAVLEIDVLDSSSAYPEPISGERFVGRIDEAVDALARAGIVDPNRVGMIGFAEGGWHVYHAITHPGRTRIVAAVCADSWQDDCQSYSSSGKWNVGFGKRQHLVNGGKPFWANTATRIEKDTSFNVHRVAGATLFTLNGGSGSTHFDGIETIGAFILNGKPVDYLYFPEGEPQLQRPFERLATYEATVDWLMFWLQGYEDPSPNKTEQYARWREIRRRAADRK
jgi:hypothetical protein